MNVSAHLFRNAAYKRAAPRIGGCAVAAVLLAGCAAGGFGEASVDPASPIAADVARAANADRPYPTFASIPSTPTDVRGRRAYGRAADEVEAAGIELERQTGPGAWTLEATEGFAARAQGALGREAAPAAAEDPEAFARRLRERATPPPPPR